MTRVLVWGRFRREGAVPQLEFCREKDGPKIASVQAGDPAVIPSDRDLVYVPDGEDRRVYIHVRVSGRQFYYDQQGHLAMVRLICEDL
jgi:hypothetical protein